MGTFRLLDGSFNFSASSCRKDFSLLVFDGVVNDFAICYGCDVICVDCNCVHGVWVKCDDGVRDCHVDLMTNDEDYVAVDFYAGFCEDYFAMDCTYEDSVCAIVSALDFWSATCAFYVSPSFHDSIVPSNLESSMNLLVNLIFFYLLSLRPNRLPSPFQVGRVQFPPHSVFLISTFFFILCTLVFIPLNVPFGFFWIASNVTVIGRFSLANRR